MSDPGSSAPVAEGEQLTVEIEEIGEEGDGVAEVNSFVVLVPDGDLGEVATVEVERVEENFAVASKIDEESAV